MALDTRLPLGVQPVDTSQAVPAMQEAQNNALLQVKQQYENATAEEKFDVLSTGLGALKTLQLAEASPDAVIPFLEQRLGNIEARAKSGQPINGNDTKLLLDTYRKNPEEGAKLAQSYFQTAKIAGAFDGIKSKSDGGDTGVILDRLKAAAEGRGMVLDDIGAMEILKGGAGQAGKNAANIKSGFDANYQTGAGDIAGKQAAEAGLEGGPSKAEIAGDVKSEETKAANTQNTIKEIDTTIEDLQGFSELTQIAKQEVDRIPEYKLGPIQGRISQAIRDPDVKNLVGIQNTMTLKAKTLLGMPSANFSDADRDFMTEIAGGSFPSGASFKKAVERLDTLNDAAIARLQRRKKNLGAVSQEAAPIPGENAQSGGVKFLGFE